MYQPVHHHAASGVRSGDGISTGHSVAGGGDPGGDLSGRLDGCKRIVPAGTQLRLTPGQSISITPYLYHDFEVEKGSGPVLLGEVSQCNDDLNDNRFNPPVGRFPAIEEDELPYRLLCTEYPAAE